MSETEVLGVRLAEIDKERVERLIKMGYYLNSGDFLRDAVRARLEHLDISFVRDVDIKTAKKEVLDYVKGNPNVYADEIAAKLNLDIETVIDAIDKLIEEKKVGV